MSLLLLWGGASGTVSFTPIAFGNTLAILMPDEVATGAATTVYAEVIDSSGSVTPDEALQLSIYGFDSGGTRTVVQAVAQMSVVSGNLYALTWTPTTSGTYEVVVAAKVGGTAYPAARALTVRPKFDPIGLAVDDVLVSRTGDDDVLGTA